MIPDPLAAIVAYLLDTRPVWSRTEGRVYMPELPASVFEDGKPVSVPEKMPRPTVVLTRAGGIRPRDWVPRTNVRVDCKCYGNEPPQGWIDASDLDMAVYEAMQYMTRQVYKGTLLYLANAEGGPMEMRDPDTDWPYVWRSYVVTVGEKYV